MFCFAIVNYSQAQDENPKYDAALASKLGADEYGMKMYVLVILKTGSNTSESKETQDKLFAGHMENMGKLVKANQLIVAGPISKNEANYRGIFILNVKTIKEAQAILETDPAIKAKVLAADCYNWYGSAALAEYLPFSEKVNKKNF